MMKQNFKVKLKTVFTRTKALALSAVLVLAYAVLAFSAPTPNTVDAAIPKYINFQGKLTKVSDGTNVSNATYAFRFKLYDDPIAGSLLWTEEYDQGSGACEELEVINGVFNTKLGSCASLAAVDFSGGALYLSVDFAPTGTAYDGEMSPRKQLVSSAFAFVANSVIGDGKINTENQAANALTVGRLAATPALQVDTNTASSVTGLKVTSAAAAGGVALTAISSGTNENITLDAKGTGTISIGAASTGDILLAGGSGATGCTVTNSNGNLTCAGNILGATTGTVGYWARSGTLISPATAGDDISLPTGDFIGLSGSTARLVFNDAGRDNVTLTDGDLLFSADNTWDIGASGATRARTIYAGTSLIAPTINATTALQQGGADINTAGTLTNVAYENQVNTFTANNIFQPTVTTGTGATAGLQIVANSLTTGNGLDVSSSSLSSGNLVNLAVTGTAGASSQKVINVSTTGAITGTQTTYGGYFSNTHSGGTSTNVGLYATATGGTNNYAAIFDAGNVGIGTTSPTAKLQVVDNVTGFSSTNAVAKISGTGGAYGLITETAGVAQYSARSTSHTDRELRFQLYSDGNVYFSNALFSGTAAANLIIATGEDSGTNTGEIRISPGGSQSAVFANNGNVGIGSTAPDRPLEVNSATGLGIRLTYNDADGSATNFADLQVSSAGALNILPSAFIANVGGGATRTALRFLEPSGTGTDYAAIQANSNVTTSYTWTLPAADASGCIQSNGSGALSIAACGGGGLTVGTTAIASGTAGRILFEGSGNVLQEAAGLAWDNTDASLVLTTSSTTAANKALNVSQTGATSGTDYAGYFSNTGAATTNVGLYATATGATNNYAAIFENGLVGIGTTTPQARLDISGTDIGVNYTTPFGQVIKNVQKINNNITTDPATDYATGLLVGSNMNIASGTVSGTQISGLLMSGGTDLTDGATYDSTSPIIGVYAATSLLGTGSVDTGVGGTFNVIRSNSGVVTNMRGVNVQNANYVGAGTIADVRGVNIQQPLSTAGSTMTNIYGLYLENQTPAAGTVTNTPYGIYQAGSANYNYFAGNTGIGTTAPTGGKLQVNTNDTTPSLLLVAADNQPYIMRATNSTFSGSPAFSYYVDNDGTLLQGTDQATNFQIYTDGYANPRLTIDAAGDVGIGTTAPDRPLEVNSATGLGVRLTYNDSNGSAANFADLQVSSGGAFNILPSGFIANVGGGTTQTALRFLEPSGTGTDYAAIQANANVTTSYTWTLPAADASGCIQSNGSGTLSIGACGGGSLTPWTSAIDADGYALQDALNLEFRTAAGSAPGGTVIALFADNSGDLTANVLTGKTYNIAVNGTDEYNFSSTALAMNSNNITGVGTNITATAALTLASTSADLTLQTNTSGNVILNSTGGTIELQDATNVTGALDVSTTLAVGTANAFQVAADGNLTSANAGTWTFSNDTNFALTGGVNGLSIDGTTFSVDGNSDRVGIGTAAPIVKFQVAGTALIQPDTTWSSGDSSVLLFSDDNSNRIEAYYTPAANSGSLNLRGYSGVDLTTNLGVVLHSTQGAMTNIGSNNDADALLEVNGNRTVAAWGLNGVQFQTSASTFTDSSTAISGTATNAIFNSFGISTLAASNATVTTTNAANVYIAGAPTAGTNQTITNAYALWVDSDNVRFDGNVGIGIDVATSLLHVQQAADSTNVSTPIAFDINSVGSAGELTASSGLQTFARIAPTINQTSTASYRALDINVTETAVSGTSGLNRLADLRVGSSSKLAIANNGTLTLQNAASLVTPNQSVGTFQNHLVRSDDFGSTWTVSSVSAITNNTQTAPDGSVSAESLAGSGAGGYVQQDTSTAISADTYTLSVWARSTSGTQSFDLRIDGTGSGTGTAVTHTATTSWQRFSVTQAVGGFTGNVRVRIYPGSSGTGTIYAWGAQLEKSTTANAYAKTTGAALTNNNRGTSNYSNLDAVTGFSYGSRNIIQIETGNNVDATYIGQFIRVIDNDCATDCDNTTKGLEVQAYSGSNLAGTNIGVDAYGYTFGVKATSTGQASNVAQPAALFADLDNGSATTTGNAIRAYTDNATSADLVSFYQEASAYTGNGLEMNFGNGAGSFTGNFISLQKSGTQSFHVDDDGSTFVSFTGTGTAHAVCHATNGNTNDDELVDCTSAPAADFAEMYSVDAGIDVGDIVVTGTEMVNTYNADENGGIDWNNVKGQISKLKKSTKSYQNNIIGIVSDNYFDFISTGYNIKPEDNPKSIALKGRVLVKVTNENGPIKAGDFITSSKTQLGYGAKATRSGTVVGQALGDINFESSNTGLVMVFVQVGYESIGNTIALDAPVISGTNLQSGEQDLAMSNAASTFTIQQQESEEGSEAVANILQLQTGDQNRFMVSSTGATSILSNLNCELSEDACPSVLKVTQGSTELINIDARGTLALSGTIIIKDDSFAGSLVTEQDGLAEVTFSYHLGTGKPVVQLTVEAQIPVFAQIVEFKQDEDGNYTGFVIKTFDMLSGPIQATVHYTVTGKQAGYITFGNVATPPVQNFGDGYGIIIEGGEVVNDGGNSPNETDESSPPEEPSNLEDITSNNES